MVHKYALRLCIAAYRQCHCIHTNDFKSQSQKCFERNKLSKIGNEIFQRFLYFCRVAPAKDGCSPKEKSKIALVKSKTVKSTIHDTLHNTVLWISDFLDILNGTWR